MTTPFTQLYSSATTEAVPPVLGHHLLSAALSQQQQQQQQHHSSDDEGGYVSSGIRAIDMKVLLGGWRRGGVSCVCASGGGREGEGLEVVS